MRLTTFLVLAAAMLAPGTASAAELAAIDRVGFVTAGPAISGERVAYATTGDGRGRSFTLLGATLGRAPRVLFTQDAPRDAARGELGGVAVALSPTRTTFAFGEQLAVDPDGATAYQRAYAGPPAGPFAATAGSADGRIVVDAVDLSGDAQLTLERTSSSRRAMVRNLAAGGPARQIDGDRVLAARIAGDYVASSTAVTDAVQRVRVTNWRTGAELYAVDVPVTPPYGFGSGLDVQEDGTIAVRVANPASTGQQPRVDLAWASPAAPSLHRVATDVGTYVTRISAGRILFERAHGARSRELAIADLTGSVITASFPLGPVSGADLDGTRLAFATSACVYAGDVPATAPAIAPAGTCPQAALTLTTARSTSRAKVRVTVGCVMASSAGCAGAVTVQTPKARGRKVLVLATRAYTVDAGASRSFTVTIPQRRLDAVRARIGHRRRTAIVDVIARAMDDASLTTSTRRDASLRLR